MSDQLRAQGKAPSKQVARAALKIIERRCAGPLSVSDVAGELGVSRRTLQRILAAAGTDFSASLQQARARRAGRMLAEGVAVGEVAASCGYQSSSHFSAVVFPAWFCLSPTEFVRAIRLYQLGLQLKHRRASQAPVDLAGLMARRVLDRESSDWLEQRLERAWPAAQARFNQIARELSRLPGLTPFGGPVLEVEAPTTRPVGLGETVSASE